MRETGSRGCFFMWVVSRLVSCFLPEQKVKRSPHPPVQCHFFRKQGFVPRWPSGRVDTWGFGPWPHQACLVRPERSSQSGTPAGRHNQGGQSPEHEPVGGRSGARYVTLVGSLLGPVVSLLDFSFLRSVLLDVLPFSFFFLHPPIAGRKPKSATSRPISSTRSPGAEGRICTRMSRWAGGRGLVLMQAFADTDNGLPAFKTEKVDLEYRGRMTVSLRRDM